MTIDLFASNLNKQFGGYASWRPDWQASFVDAFTMSWSNEFFYAFPPFSLIRGCLEKINLDKAEGVIVVLGWPTQTWYTPIHKMLMQQLRMMLWKPAGTKLLIRRSGTKIHNMQGKLKLMACPLSNDTMKFQGIPRHILFESWRASSQKQYAVHLNRWDRFCREWKTAPYSSIHCARSYGILIQSISFILCQFTYRDIGFILYCLCR